MSTNVIQQTLMGEPGSQTIKMVVRSNERGATGPQGEPGEAATISAGTAYSVPAGQAPAVMNTGTSSAAVFDFYIPKGEKGDPGKDGAFYYKAGAGIRISDDNVINATGTAEAAWGDIGGNIQTQTDLINLINSKEATWGGINGTITNQTDLTTYVAKMSPTRVYYGVCNTGSSTTQKVITTKYGNFEKVDGSILVVRFSNADSGVNQPTFVVDGKTVSNVNTLPFQGGSCQIYIYNQTYDAFADYRNKASTSNYGVTKLYNGHDSTSNALAATANAVKDVYDAIPTVNNSTISFTNNGTAVDSFTTNASSAKTIDFSAPVITMTTTDPGEGASLAANNFIAVYSA